MSSEPELRPTDAGTRATVERVVEDALAPTYRFCQSKALTAKARGLNDRPWLDVLLNLDALPAKVAKALAAQDDEGWRCGHDEDCAGITGLGACNCTLAAQGETARSAQPSGLAVNLAAIRQRWATGRLGATVQDRLDVEVQDYRDVTFLLNKIDEFANALTDPARLAAAVEQAKREALVEAADAVHSRFEHSLLNTEECEWVENWLRDRAASVARTGDTPVQCGETRIHEPHGDCPGLDGHEVPNPRGVEDW